MGADNRSSTSRWMDLFFAGRLVSLCGAQKPVNENFCGTTHRKQVKPHISIWKFNLSGASPPPNTQEDLPQVTSQTQPFRAPQRGSDPVLGEGKDLTQRGFSGPELEVQRETCLWLWTPGRAHRNCWWMWAPRRCCKAKETWIQGGCVSFGEMQQKNCTLTVPGEGHSLLYHSKSVKDWSAVEILCVKSNIAKGKVDSSPTE